MFVKPLHVVFLLLVVVVLLFLVFFIRSVFLPMPTLFKQLTSPFDDHQDVFYIENRDNHLQKELKYVQTIYGNNFSVDINYPKTYRIFEYTHSDFDFNQPLHKSKTEYPQKMLLTMIHTSSTRITDMENTRNTWCQSRYQKEFGFKCVFLIVRKSVEQNGKKDFLERMNATTKDIYFINMPLLEEKNETRHQQDIASFVTIFDTFKDYKFYAKVNDNVMINVEMLMDVLISLPEEETVVGEFNNNKPNGDITSKCYDLLAQRYARYFIYPSGYLAIYSRSLSKFFAEWKNYYCMPPTSSADPALGFLMYKYAKNHNKKIHLISPELWKNEGNETTCNAIVFNKYTKNITQVDKFTQCVKDGHFVNKNASRFYTCNSSTN
ncbi:hypothetical protein EIN_075970 [Entamoeba invadens IP1]|uniref:Hexosyltransferase n=1 Tax=Entamoeba invadens IP1 TaxID=370355 RepID=A0A0A1TW83_ENTIV|nr:hypothetical protein EIN_075970 [Entamoeba invadens IP1]ELP84788.1 hypothetical protein EIN_075970 [Entamoeba invadens IP1]|eukprot:XP_004184134.1 hypothetical protein EIN_075970 [Entamoeba invadens IP1]